MYFEFTTDANNNDFDTGDSLIIITIVIIIILIILCSLNFDMIQNEINIAYPYSETDTTPNIVPVR